MIDLIKLFKQLKKPEDSNNHILFSASPIPKFEKHRLAKDINSYPCLLISTQDFSDVRPPPIKLEHLQVLYDVNCKIFNNNLLEEKCFTVIRCMEHDQLMQEYFLRIGSAIIAVIGTSPSHLQVAKTIDNLVELFRVMDEAPKKSVQGLWAELFVISLAKDIVTLVKSWHKSPDDKYDFGFEDQRIEVKSATSRIRKHHFSLEQLKPVLGIKIIVASVFVERVGNGTSVTELADKIRVKISNNPDLLLHLDQIIGLTLGNDWKSASKDRFDNLLAKKALEFFFSENIPCIDAHLPKEITDVHFKVDITNAPAIDRQVLKSERGIFSAVLPK